MPEPLSALIESFDGRAVITHHDRPTGTWVFISIHDDTLGNATGGTRMRVYDDPADGLLDGMRLARGMTSKWAALGLPFGGAKAVLAIRQPLEGEARRGLLERYGELLESLNGVFSTGEDLGTTPDDFRVIASKTRFVHGFDPATGDKIDPGPFTARGVFSGMRAAAGVVFPDGLQGRRVLIQGVGHVGGRLAEMVRDADGRVLASDIDESLASRVAREVGGVVVPASEAYTAECDIYAPCAIGATLNERTIGQLRCRLIAGSANNQLETAEDAARLHERGIVYAPDYVVNGGGALAFALLGAGETDFDVIMERMEDVGRAIGSLLDEAARRDESPLVSADRRVRRVLERARREA